MSLVFGIGPVEVDPAIREVFLGERSVAVLRFRALVEQLEIDLARLHGDAEEELALARTSPLPRLTCALDEAEARAHVAEEEPRGDLVRLPARHQRVVPAVALVHEGPRARRESAPYACFTRPSLRLYAGPPSPATENSRFIQDETPTA